MQEAEWQELVGHKWLGDVGRETAWSSPVLACPRSACLKGREGKAVVGMGVSRGTQLRRHRKLETSVYMFMHTHTCMHVACSCAHLHSACSQQRGLAAAVSSGSCRPTSSACVQVRQPPRPALSCKLLSSPFPWVGCLSLLLWQLGCGQTFVLSLGRGERKSPDAVYVTSSVELADLVPGSPVNGLKDL